jgi:hypothetical protein
MTFYIYIAEGEVGVKEFCPTEYLIFVSVAA